MRSEGIEPSVFQVKAGWSPWTHERLVPPAGVAPAIFRVRVGCFGFLVTGAYSIGVGTRVRHAFMTVAATNFALVDFFENARPRATVVNHGRYVMSFRTSNMIEFQYNGIRFTTVPTRMLTQVLHQPVT